jgi:sulfur carrier protein ThiS
MTRPILLSALIAALALPAPTPADDAAPETSPTPPLATIRKPTFEVYGFAQVDLIQDFKRVRPDWNATLRPTRIPTEEGLYGANGESIFSARQSRLGARGSLPAGEYDLFARIEFDFFGLGEGRPDAGGQNTLRLRQAYGSWGPLLGGLTASLFMDDDFWPTIIDYWGPAGMVFYRNVQIRYTPFTGEHSFAVALERPATDLDPTGGPAGIAPRALIPDLTAQYRLAQGWGYLQVAGILRWLGYDTPGAAVQTKGEAIGWGLHASSQVKLIPDRLKLLVAVAGGTGFSYYMNDATPDLAFGGTLAAPKAEAVPLLGITAYLDIYWSKLFSSAVGYSTMMMFNTGLQGPESFKTGQYASANFLVTPVRNLITGPELLWGQRTDKGGAYGTDIRLQVSVKYAFTSLDFWKPN